VYFNVNFNVFFKLIKVNLLVSELYVAEEQLASQEGLWSMELFNYQFLSQNN